MTFSTKLNLMTSVSDYSIPVAEGKCYRFNWLSECLFILYSNQASYLLRSFSTEAILLYAYEVIDSFPS